MPVKKDIQNPDAGDNGSLLILRVPDGCKAITLHYPEDDIPVELKRDRRSDGHDHFVNADGTVIPLGVPAKIDVLKYVEDQPGYFVTDQQIDKATDKAKLIYEQRRKSGNWQSQSLKLKTIAREGMKNSMPNLSKVILNQCAETIRKRLKTWIEKEYPGKK